MRFVLSCHGYAQLTVISNAFTVLREQNLAGFAQLCGHPDAVHGNKSMSSYDGWAFH